MKRYIKASRGDEFIGIWWYTDDGDIWADYCHVDDGVIDGIYLQYSSNKNHENQWRSIVKNYISDSKKQSELITKGFRCYERGRVIYDTQSQVYLILCSRKLVTDSTFRNKIISDRKSVV